MKHKIKKKGNFFQKDLNPYDFKIDPKYLHNSNILNIFNM